MKKDNFQLTLPPVDKAKAPFLELVEAEEEEAEAEEEEPLVEVTEAEDVEAE